MRRSTLLIFLIGLLTISACSDKEEVIDQLKMDAEQHEELGKRQEAILIYEKVLNMENDPEVQERVQKLKSEQD